MQFLTLLLGGGLAGLVGAVLSNVIEWQKVEDAAALANQDFVNKYLTYVIDKDLDTRIRIAEYFQFILQDTDHRDRWKQYLVAIEEKRQKWTPQYAKLLDKQELNKPPLNRDENLRLVEIAKYFGEAEKLRIGVPKEAPPPQAATPIIAPSPAAQQLADCARSLARAKEKPPQFDEYIRSVGLGPNEPVPGWSDAFIGWCLQRVAPSLESSPDVYKLWAKAEQKGLIIRPTELRKTSDIRIGDIYFMGRMAFGGGIVVDVTEKPKFVGVEGVGDSVNLTQRDLSFLPFFRGLIRLKDEGGDQGVATVTDQPPRVEPQGPTPTPNPEPPPNPQAPASTQPSTQAPATGETNAIQNPH
jgi:hypothetical protein